MGASKKGSDLLVAFDIGYSSIGWSVLTDDPDSSSTAIMGTGSVVFPTNDCLASERRSYRRQRHHIRSTRERIKRIEKLLSHIGILNMSELESMRDAHRNKHNGGAYPWLLAGKVLSSNGQKLLSWPELWTVLRWYAHNRGYDGNKLWSKNASDEERNEDTEKEQNALHLMEVHGKQSMAETVCAFLGIDPASPKTNKSSRKYFKGGNYAFPRSVVIREVETIIRAHFGKLKNCNEAFLETLCGSSRLAWGTLPCADIRLPKRYQGGLLFGQYVPRFDNRIISTCSITGLHVPSARSKEFLSFRFAMLLANVRIGEKLEPLGCQERQSIFQLAQKSGRWTIGEFKKAVRETTACLKDNLDALFLHPRAGDALILDPALVTLTNSPFSGVLPLLPSKVKNAALTRLNKSRGLSLSWLREKHTKMGGDSLSFDATVETTYNLALKKHKGKELFPPRETFIAEDRFAKFPIGRAPYAHSILKSAVEEVLTGKHPAEIGGCLYLSEELREQSLRRPLDERSNNHLVRHRLLILGRVLEDIIKEYAGGDKTKIRRVGLEVARDLPQMSGKKIKEIAQEIGKQLAHHTSVSKKLANDLEHERVNGNPIRIGPGLIRKARVADDLGWKCPYTGKAFEPADLVHKRVDLDHIIPRSQRASDSLDSLVLTFSEVNRMKRDRTAWQFIRDHETQNRSIPDNASLTLFTSKQYKEFVEKLTTRGSHEDDVRRRRRRKELMLLENYSEKQFTQRDLTITSHLNKLAAQKVESYFADIPKDARPQIVTLPGVVTGLIRKSWKLLGCLGLACPEVLDENGGVKSKTEIRGITHLHHALDACVIGLAVKFMPREKAVLELMSRRSLRSDERDKLQALGLFDFNTEGRFTLSDLNPTYKEQIRQRLAECRVVQHLPKSRDGIRVEQNIWRVVKIENGRATLRQRIRTQLPDGTLAPAKESNERTSKLLGLPPDGQPSKLSKLKGVLVISDNYGLALDPQPEVIPWIKVHQKLQSLQVANGGKMPSVLRNGMIIQVQSGTYPGTWKIFSIKDAKDGILLDIGRPDVVRLKNKTPGHIINARLSSLMKGGLTPSVYGYTGLSQCPTTLSISTAPTAV